MEYSTFKQLKEAAETIKQQQKIEEEKRKQKEEQEKQEAFLQRIAQFLQPKPPEQQQIERYPSPKHTHKNDKPDNLVTIDMLNRQKDDIISTITQTIRENQMSFHPNTEKKTKTTPTTPSLSEGIDLDKRAWIKNITIKLKSLKTKKDWISALETLRKRFKHEIEVKFDNLNKKEAIEKLAKKFALYGRKLPVSPILPSASFSLLLSFAAA